MIPESSSEGGEAFRIDIPADEGVRMCGGGRERVDDADAREEHDGEVRVEEVDEGEVTGWEMNVEEMVSAQKEPIRIECRPD